MISRVITSDAGWLTGGGPQADIVLSSRARLARNVAGFGFLTRAGAAERRDIERAMRESVMEAGLADDLIYAPMHEMDDVSRRVLLERHLVSREMVAGDGERGVAVGRHETLSIMVNEEDHLRLQTLCGGFDLDAVWSAVDEADDRLAERVTYAFSEEFGYLTACPTNVGTGLRVSVMLHLPAMVMSRHIEKVFNAVAKLNLVVRGLYGEGTQAVGDLYQVSNQHTLGRAEEDLVRNLAAVVPQVVDYERQVRDAMLQQGRVQTEDQVWRAFGILSSARSIASEETLYLLSRVRLGVGTGMITEVDMNTLNRLLLVTQPAHIQQMHGAELSAEERNERRATLIRNALAGTRPDEKE